jgi:hypothetical protein
MMFVRAFPPKQHTFHSAPVVRVDENCQLPVSLVARGGDQEPVFGQNHQRGGANAVVVPRAKQRGRMLPEAMASTNVCDMVPQIVRPRKPTVQGYQIANLAGAARGSSVCTQNQSHHTLTVADGPFWQTRLTHYRASRPLCLDLFRPPPKAVGRPCCADESTEGDVPMAHGTQWRGYQPHVLQKRALSAGIMSDEWLVRFSCYLKPVG